MGSCWQQNVKLRASRTSGATRRSALKKITQGKGKLVNGGRVRFRRGSPAFSSQKQSFGVLFGKLAEGGQGLIRSEIQSVNEIKVSKGNEFRQSVRGIQAVSKGNPGIQ